jgi:hypothetical protein
MLPLVIMCRNEIPSASHNRPTTEISAHATPQPVTCHRNIFHHHALFPKTIYPRLPAKSRAESTSLGQQSQRHKRPQEIHPAINQ